MGTISVFWNHIKPTSVQRIPQDEVGIIYQVRRHQTVQNGNEKRAPSPSADTGKHASAFELLKLVIRCMIHINVWTVG